MSVPERVHFLRICFCPSPRLKKSQEQDWYRCTKWHMFWCNFPERSYVYPPGYAGLEPRRIKSESNGKPGGDLSSSVWHVTISNVNGSVLELEMNLRQVLSFTITEKAPTRNLLGAFFVIVKYWFNLRLKLCPLYRAGRCRAAAL